jgi:signal transduction histidine kinase
MPRLRRNSFMPHSLAARQELAFVAAAVGLMLLAGAWTTFLLFNLYDQTAKAAIDGTTSTIRARIAENALRHGALTDLAPRITRDLGQPQAHIAVFDQELHLIGESGPAQSSRGVVGAIASLMALRPTCTPVTGTDGVVVVTPDLYQLERKLRAYLLWMVPAGLVAVILAWFAGVMITRQAVLPLRQISAAMRRFAEGDFRSEPVRSAAYGELGELAHAYNRATHQVQSALTERDRREAEVRRFIADASHELRAPLTVLTAYLDVLDDGAREWTLPQCVIAMMRQESRRMRALIEQLIYLTRLDRGATILVTAAPDARVADDWSERSLIASELEILR